MGFGGVRREFKTEWGFRKRRNAFQIIVRDKVHKPYSTIMNFKMM